MTPHELVSLAREKNLLGLSITDHDTVAAYEEFIPFANKVDLKWISGVEFSADLNGVSVHTLAYSFSLNHKSITNLCNRHSERRAKRNKTIFDLLAKKGMPIAEQEFIESIRLSSGQLPKSIGRPHIGLAMIKKGYVKTLREAFQLYIGNGKSCYRSVDPISVEETLDAIHTAGGFAVIAHPHLIRHSKTEKALLTMNFDGIEVFYGTLHYHREEPWLKAAKKRDWLITGGSDFHGTNKPQNLGCSYIGKDHFTPLYDRHRQNNS